MTWTDERIERLKALWEQGSTASQIAEDLGGVSRNAVIGKAHRLGLQARPSPVKPNEPAISEPDPIVIEASSIAEPRAEIEPDADIAVEPIVEPEDDVIEASDEVTDDEPASKPAQRPILAEFRPTPPPSPYPPAVPSGPTGAQLRSVGPGGFLRQGPGDQAPPAAPAPPRRLVPARPNADMASKTTLLDLTDKICKWPLGHPGEPDFHFCGDTVNPGFPYCVAHCGQAYQAQLPRRDRRGAPPLPFGGPRVR